MTLVSMPAYAHGGPLRSPVWIVVHSMETDITDAIAEALSGPSWFGGPRAGTSPHQSYDSFGPGVRNLPSTVVAYHAGPTANTYGIGKEHAGRASFTRAQWTTPKGLAMLRASAAETAVDCLEHGIPPRWLSVVQVARKERGLCTHNDIRLAFPQDTSHSDPGPNFPYDLYLQFVQEEIARLTGTAQEDDDMTPDQDAMLRFLYNRIAGRDVQRWMKQNPDGSPIITGPDDPEGWPARSVDIADILTLTGVVCGGDAAVLAHVDAGSAADADRDARLAAQLGALGTDPAAIVEALRAGLGDAFAKQVVAELGKQLAA